jgi:hypothetical protein
MNETQGRAKRKCVWEQRFNNNPKALAFIRCSKKHGGISQSRHWDTSRMQGARGTSFSPSIQLEGSIFWSYPALPWSRDKDSEMLARAFKQAADSQLLRKGTIHQLHFADQLATQESFWWPRQIITHLVRSSESNIYTSCLYQTTQQHLWRRRRALHQIRRLLIL